MKIREVDLLRLLVDLIDTQGNESEVECDVEQVEEPHCDSEMADEENPMHRDDVFIPPLQAKLEMMKMMSGVEQKNQDLVHDQEEPTDIGAKPKRSVAATLMAALEDDPFDE